MLTVMAITSKGAAVELQPSTRGEDPCSTATKSAFEKLVIAGEQAGFSIDRLIDLFDRQLKQCEVAG